MLTFALELSSTILTLICVIFCRLQKKSGWVYGLIGAALLVPLFYLEGIWGQCILSVIYVLMSIFGIQQWGKDNEITFRKKHNSVIMFISLLISLFILIYFEFGLESIDYVIVGLSLIANVLLIYKATESWVLWIAVNILSITLFLSSGLYLLTFIYIIFTINAIIAFIQWSTKHIVLEE